VLDDVAFGAFAEQPARKDAVPFIVALILHGQLDEGAGFGRIFPWRGLFASAQPYDRASGPHRFARFHFQILDQPVALVEQTQHRDPIRHRRRAFDPADFLRHTLRFRDLWRLAAAPRPAVAATIAAGQQRRGGQRRDQDGKSTRHRGRHSAPGRQAS
jgi:hypothetical protein